MELANLPEIEFAAKSAANIEAAVITMYETISGRTLAAGDPVRLFLESVAAIIVQQRALIDYTGKQNLLAYAAGDNLEHIGALVGVERLSASTATTTLRFALSIAQPQSVIIPAGTRASPGNDILFATTETVAIAAGQTTVDVGAACTQTGATGNGYLPGQISKIIVPIQWVASVTNITASEGGGSVESDDSYRVRIQQAPEKFSVAGPDGAYVYHALQASSLITDVSVQSPSPGVVEIRPLLTNGVIPGQEILDLVMEACSNRSVRPLTDHVQVLAPVAVPYAVDVTYWIDASDSTNAAAIQSAVEAAVSNWVLWQKSKIGRDINPSELTARMVQAGAKRVQITSPAFTALDLTQVGIASSQSVLLGGLENG